MTNLSRLSFLKSGKPWVKGITVFAAMFTLIACIRGQIEILHSSTGSLPYRTFLLLKKLSSQKGGYTCFDSPWYGGKVIKKVAGTAGDAISYDRAGHLWVGGLKVGKPHKKARDGRPLTPLPPGVIPKGKVFVAGDHERSFDSRYAELGLLPVQSLQGRVTGLW